MLRKIALLSLTLEEVWNVYSLQIILLCDCAMLVAMATTAGSENLPTERSIGYDTDCKQAVTDTLEST